MAQKSYEYHPTRDEIEDEKTLNVPPELRPTSVHAIEHEGEATRKQRPADWEDALEDFF